MAAFGGKWKLISYENREAFLKAIGIVTIILFYLFDFSYCFISLLVPLYQFLCDGQLQGPRKPVHTVAEDSVL